MDDLELRCKLKALHLRQMELEKAISEKWKDFEASLEPLHVEIEISSKEMNDLLGESRSWIVGRYDSAGLPILE